MRVLVTGAAGRLGRSVVAVLAGTHEVVAVDRTVPDAACDDATWHVADLLDPGQLADVLARSRPEAVVHLAAIATPFSRPEAEIFTVNTSLAWLVLEQSLAAGSRVVVAASSPTVLGYGCPTGWTPRRLPLDEDHPVAPWNAYAASKVVVEEIVRTQARANPQAVVAAIRPCYVITPEEWAGAPTQQGHTVVERLERPELAAPALFNYVDARDVGELLLAVLATPDRLPSGQVLFAGAPDALARRPLAELLPQFHPGTAELASVLTGRRPAFSTAAAERLLGWQPRRSWRTELR